MNKKIISLFLLAIILTGVQASPSDPEKPVVEPFVGNKFPDDMWALNLSQDSASSLHRMDVIISNFGEESHKEKFHKAIEHYLLSQQYYLRRKFLDQYRELRKANDFLSQIAQEILPKSYQDYSLKLLNETSLLVSLANDPRALHLVKEGFYSYQRGINLLQRALYMDKFQYSQKVKYYLEATQQFRTANRYASRALIEVKTPIAIKKEHYVKYKNIYIPEQERLSFNEYEDIYLSLVSLFKRPMLSENPKFMLLDRHADNYGNLMTGKKSEYLQYAWGYATLLEQVVTDNSEKEQETKEGE